MNTKQLPLPNEMPARQLSSLASNRYEIVRELVNGPLAAKEIASRLDLRVEAVRARLERLRLAEVVRRVDVKPIRYGLNDSALEGMVSLLEKMRELAATSAEHSKRQLSIVEGI